jgi:hypothetical protein
MQLWEAKSVRVELDATQWSQLRNSGFELCLESNVEKKYRQEPRPLRATFWQSQSE